MLKKFLSLHSISKASNNLRNVEFYFQINFKLKSVRNISETFCNIDSYNSQNEGRFALAQRGGCEFLTKALFAQSAGYDGIIILDNQEDTPFTRIIYERTNNRAFFVRIPVIFLLQNEVDVIEKLPLGSYSATLQNDRRDKFFPIWTKSLDKIKKNLPKVKAYFASLSPISWIILGKNQFESCKFKKCRKISNFRMWSTCGMDTFHIFHCVLFRESVLTKTTKDFTRQCPLWK